MLEYGSAGTSALGWLARPRVLGYRPHFGQGVTRMTEAEWLSAADPFAMFAHLGEQAGWRKRQLYCVACWNRVLHLLTDGYSRKALAYLEAHNSFDWNDQDADEYEEA